MPISGAPKKKKLPNVDIDTQIALLLHPGQNPTGYEPFIDADRFPFEPNAASLSCVNAWWLVEASWLSYSSSEAFIQSMYRTRAGMDAVLLTASGTDVTVAWSREFAIVAFRGTQPDQWEDIYSDKQWVPRPWDAGHVHKGFAEALAVVWPKLADTLGQLGAGCRVWFTGHSLGAALATLAAYRLSSTAGVCTFGGPLVGNQMFAGAFNTRFNDASLRYVNDYDIVTRVPPEEFAFPFGRYTHVDDVRWIDPAGAVHRAVAGPIRFFSAVIGQPAFMLHLMTHLEAFRLPSLPDALRDHTPLHYVIHVWNDLVAQAQAELVAT